MHRLACLLMVLLAALPAAAAGYDYPFANPYMATVLGTPKQAEYPVASVRPSSFGDLLPIRNLGLIEDREILLHDRPVPDVLWYDDTLQYSVALQRAKAPLLFVIAGTGSSYKSETCRYLQEIFHRAGFHVVTLSSSTYPNFVVSASVSQVPGYIPDDVGDLYGSMVAIVGEIGRERISSINLTGYSLGGTQAAFLAAMDAHDGRLGFDKVMLLNPAVNLVASTDILDHLLIDNVSSKEEAVGVVAGLIEELSQAYRDSNAVNFGDEFLYALKGSPKISEKELKILIGVAFRLSLANMVFASDACTGAGYIVPRGYEVTRNESMSPYLDASVGISFDDYINEYLVPYLAWRDPAMTREKAVQACSLESIGSFLKEARNIRVATNTDDLILTGDNFAFLRETFGQRLTVYPHGGHCGNIRYRDNVAAMLDFFLK